MNMYYGSVTKFNFQPVENVEKGDIVWVVWNHYNNGDGGDTATPTKVTKVYNDGNILHHRRGYDDLEFAWAKDIVAKTPDVPFDRIPYRTMKVSQIRKEIDQNQFDARNKVEAN